MSALVPLEFEDADLVVESDPHHVWLASSVDVAAGYGVSPGALRSTLHRHDDELTEGIHWIRCASDRRARADLGNLVPQPMTLWTRRGVIRLGMFIRTARAKRFRDWAEDLILAEHETFTHEQEPSDVPPAAAAPVGLDALRALHQTTGAVLELAEQAERDRVRLAHVEHAQAETAARVEQLHAKVDRRHPDDEQLEPITPTSIGRSLVPPVSGIVANRMLQDCGFQWFQDQVWSPTHEGRPYAVVRPVELPSGRVHEQLLWQRRIVPVLERRLARRAALQQGASS